MKDLSMQNIQKILRDIELTLFNLSLKLNKIKSQNDCVSNTSSNSRKNSQL